ncbi:MAG TPA: hypothetical protein VHV47_00415 [Opitutaceae bacterium]|nr:hypothetical protein [Opitutaceae bacterium]
MLRSPLRLGLLAALLLAVGWLYAWSPPEFGRHWTTAEPDGFYNELADSLRQGRLALLRRPDPRLAALPDPYDPASNAAFRVDNLSYYHGRYFLYLGIVPAATAFLPVRLLTGRYLTPEAASAGFCLLGAAAAVGTLAGLRRRSFSRAPRTVIGAAFAAAVLAGGFQVATAASLAQEVAVAAAYAFAMLGIWAASNAAEGGAAWTAAASLSLAAAAGCRPNYAVGAALAVALLGWRSRNRTGRGRLIAAAILPLLAVGAALAAYNFARFGNPVEFGQHYMFGAWNQHRLPALSAAGARLNAETYLFSPAAYSRYFPFVTLLNSNAPGVLRHVPWLWLAPVAAWGIGRSAARGAPRCGAAVCLLLGGANFLTLIFLPSGNGSAATPSSNGRYLLDFLPEAVLAISMGVLAAGEAWAGRPAARRWLTAGALFLAAASAVAGLSLDFQRFPAESYRPLAEAMDLPAFADDRLRGLRFGPARATVVFPADGGRTYEPLLETGGPVAAELLYVHYLGPNQVQFGLAGIGAAGPLSAPLPLASGRPHQLTVSMGSLFPPVGYPGWIGLTDAQIARLQRTLRIEIDGATAFEAPAYFPTSPPGAIRWGRREIIPGYSADRFSGRITGISRLGISPPADAPKPGSYGPVRLVLRFPSDKSGRAEPLVATGVPEAGDIVFVRYLDAGHVQLGFDHWGSDLAQTAALTVDRASPHALEVSMGSLLEPSSAFRASQHISVRLDGKSVLELRGSTYRSSPYDIQIGYNVIGASSCEYAFTGSILSQERVPPRAGPPGRD